MSNVVSLPTRSLPLNLLISDPDVVNELEKIEDHSDRDAYALHALRLGVLAMRQAKGSLDADAVRRQGEHLIRDMNDVFNKRSGDVMSILVRYLEPGSGLLPQRIEQLTKPDGELERMLAKHLQGDQSIVAQTLAQHLGEQSPIFKLLSPNQSEGLLAALSASMQSALQKQSAEVFKQFSLDQKESALSRLLAEVTASNGKLRTDLSEDVGKMTKEFSLDNEDGALTRLVERVDRAQKIITSEFSLDREGSALQRLSAMLEQTNEAVENSLTLDDEASPLARLKREILKVLGQQQKANGVFQSEVRSTLKTFKVRREEEARSTRHGHTFEEQLGDMLARAAGQVGDLYERVGATNGRAQRKVGDYTVELGPDSACPGARIVIEAKANKQYTLKGAAAELEDRTGKSRSAGRRHRVRSQERTDRPDLVAKNRLRCVCRVGCGGCDH